MVRLSVPYHHQSTAYTCGPAVLEMVFRFFGRKASEKSLVKELRPSVIEGTGHYKIINTARKHGFYCFVHDNSNVHQLKNFITHNLPVIINYIEPKDDESHYAVAIGFTKHSIIMNDPWDGKNFRISIKKFIGRWHNNDGNHKKWLMVINNKKFNVGRQYNPL